MRYFPHDYATPSEEEAGPGIMNAPDLFDALILISLLIVIGLILATTTWTITKPPL